MGSNAMSSSVYRRLGIETASQGKIIVMMFNGAIRRAEDAKRKIEANDGKAAHEHLLRAQDIVSELRSVLNMDAGEIARSLDRSYEYFHHLLVTANIKKDSAAIDECVGLMASLRDTWEELFVKTAREESAELPPAIDQHGASVMNIEG